LSIQSLIAFSQSASPAGARLYRVLNQRKPHDAMRERGQRE